MYNGCISISTLTQPKDTTLVDHIIARWANHSDHSAAGAYSRKELARRFLLGRSLIRNVLARSSLMPNCDYEFVANDKGKPFIKLSSGEIGPAISITHSNGMIAAAVTSIGALGIDMEFHRANRSFNAIASYAFGPQETKIASQSIDNFYKIWCLREAMSKATGKGLEEATDGVDTVDKMPMVGAWKSSIETEEWGFALLTPSRRYSLAIAIKCAAETASTKWNERSLKFEQLEFSDLIS